MAEVPTLTQEQYELLLERAASNPRAPGVGLHRPEGDDPYYRFSRKASGKTLGHYSTGDGVSLLGLQEAVRTVLETRGNYLESRVVARAYRDMLRSEPQEWEEDTALILCMLAPLLGVLKEIEQMGL